MARLFAIIDDISSEWPEGNKLLGILTTGAPIASILCNNEWRAINDLAFKLKLRDGNNGHQAVADIYAYDHPGFSDGEGHTYTGLAAAAGLEIRTTRLAINNMASIGSFPCLRKPVLPYF
jgi:hypothetical protein